MIVIFVYKHMFVGCKYIFHLKVIKKICALDQARTSTYPALCQYYQGLYSNTCKYLELLLFNFY